MTNHTKEIARKLIEQRFWEEPSFDLHDLFQIRDALTILNSYGLADLDLLDEVNKFIKQKKNL